MDEFHEKLGVISSVSVKIPYELKWKLYHLNLFYLKKNTWIVVNIKLKFWTGVTKAHVVYCFQEIEPRIVEASEIFKESFFANDEGTVVMF